MAEIILKTPVKVNIVDGKKKKTLEVEVREKTKKELKKQKELLKKFKQMIADIERLSSKLESVRKKAEYCEKLNKFKDALKYQEKADDINDELEKIKKEIDKIGGDEFNEEQSKENFDLLVSGKDKEALREVAEEKGYAKVMQILYVARDEAEGK